MKIEYWADFTCPYSYIGSMNLKQALKNLDLDADLTMHAYELNPDMPEGVWESTLQQMIEKDGMSREEAREQIASVQAYAERSSLPMHFVEEHFCNTRDAHRLVWHAQDKEPEKADALVNALFAANFADSRTLSDPAVLLDCAVQAGLDPETCEDVLKTDKYLDKVLEDKRRADEIPVETIPYFVIDGHVVDSSHPVEEFEEILKAMA